MTSKAMLIDKKNDGGKEKNQTNEDKTMERVLIYIIELGEMMKIYCTFDP